jgi:hypothetical protein
MASSWGPIHEQPADRNTMPVGSEGSVTKSSPTSFEGAPSHPVSYNATDARHNRESGLAPWQSVDPMSGPTSDTDFGSSAGRFPDGPGVWRQT